MQLYYIMIFIMPYVNLQLSLLFNSRILFLHYAFVPQHFYTATSLSLSLSHYSLTHRNLVSA